jgi:sugar lactone lactonase YvrE
MMASTMSARFQLPALLAIFAVCCAELVVADDYLDARADLIAAYQAEKYPSMLLAAQRAVAARPGYPGALFNLSLAQTLNSDFGGALDTLDSLADRGIDFGATDLDEFAALKELDGWDAYAAKVEQLLEPIGSATVVASYDDANFVPEGIAVDKEGRVLIGSIRSGRLVRLSSVPEILLEEAGGWSVFGMRFHPDGSLWFAGAAVPQLQDAGDDAGKTGLFQVDTSTGEITLAAILPQYEESQVLGDLVIADENTLYASDSLTGAIYRYYIDSNEFEVLVKRGKFVSPQGLVLDDSGNYLFVADYNAGLFRVSLADGSMAKLDVANDVSDYGIDGLYRYGDELIAIQNGSRPHKIVALRLAENSSAISASRTLASNLEQFDEPTLGVVHDNDFYFVANSHWNRFDRDNNIPEGLSGPIILKVALD